MVRTHHPEADDQSLTPAESLALIEATLRDTRGALGFSDWPFYLTWGIAWAVAFTFSHLVLASDQAPLADLPEGYVGLAWLVCVGGAGVVTGLVIRRAAHGVSGTTARVGRRLGLCWSAAFLGASLLAGLWELGDPDFGALFVFVVALLYLGQGAAFLDDLQLGLGVWLLAVDIAALAAGLAWFNLILAVFGAGGMLVAAGLARRAQLRTGLEDG